MGLSLFVAALAASLVFAALVAALPRLLRRASAFRELARGLVSKAAGRLPRRWIREAEKRILEAGSPDRLGADGLLLGTCALVALAILVGILHLGVGLPLPLVLLAWAAPLLPWLRLSSRARERKVAIARGLPFVLDLLTLVVEAGNDLLTGFARVSEKMAPGPLRDELLHTLRELKMGRSKREVFTALAARTGSPEVGRMVAAILQADRMGAPVAESLRILSTQILSERFLLAEKRAAQAPVKMLLPLVAFIFPAVFLVLFGPIALAFFSR